MLPLADPMTTRQHVPAATQWAEEIGYSRAVRVGAHVWVAGTVAVDAHGVLVGDGDAYAQAKHILSIIESALTHACASLDDVVRSRVYLKDWSARAGATKAHREAFNVARPAATFVLAGLVDPAMLVEIEVEAFIPNLASR
jgi:enamine deaminase RidA (YjgF/YER057c/UK114 family)